MSEQKIDVPDWEHLCSENARDILLNQSSEIAAVYREWICGSTPNNDPSIYDLGTAACLDISRLRDEGMSVNQEVNGVVIAATVLEIIHEQYHPTDSVVWDAQRTVNGVSVADLQEMVKSMAVGTLENVVMVRMSECHESVWENIQDKYEDAKDAALEAGEISEDEIFTPEEDTVKLWVEDLIGEW